MKYLKNIACAAILAVPLAACTEEEQDLVQRGLEVGFGAACVLDGGDDCFSSTAYYTTNGKLTEAGEKFLARHVPPEKRAAARAVAESRIKQRLATSARAGG